MALKKKILIADDELFFRNVLKEAFQERYEIIEAGNGEEAVSLALEQKPDLIILDIEMPVINGLEACEALKDRSETRRIPIVMFTSFAKKEDIVRGLDAGADDYITKPICLSEIIARVDAHLRTKDYYFDLEHKDLLFLLELSENISAIRNPRTILRLIVEKMADLVGVSRCSIDSINDAGELVVKASSDHAGKEDILLDIRKYPEINKTLETKQPTVVNDIKNDPIMNHVREYVTGLDYNAIVVVPIIKKERVIGTFVLRTTAQNKDGITPRVYKLCQLVANISSSALENAILFESLRTAQEYFEEMSIRDGLTKLYNYRHFYSRLEEEFSRAARYNTPLSLVFFDIDDFKRVNDIYGHTQGDKVLRKIGEIMRTIARESDIPARYGGEEFAILLPNTAAEGAYGVASRLCSVIREHVFEGLAEEQITISTGVATRVDRNIESFERFLQLADQAMYKAKFQGKDSIIEA
mgnify:CR=1 FL=1